MMISVKSTPTTEWFLYQPTTSVARVEARQVEMTLPNARLLSVGRHVAELEQHEQERLARSFGAFALEREGAQE